MNALFAPVTHLSLADSQALLQAVSDLALARDLDGVFAIVRRVVRAQTGADGVTFVLREGDQVYYANEDAIGPLWKGRRFSARACISGWAMEHRRAVAIADIYADERIPCEAYRPTFVKSLAMVPVRRDDPVAAIGAYWASHHEATPRELHILQAVADATALAIDRGHLLETSRRTEAELAASREALARSELRMRTLVTATAQIVWTRAPDGRAVEDSPSWRAFTGQTLEQWLGWGWLDVIHPEDRPRVVALWKDMAVRPAQFELEYRLRRPDGSYTWTAVRAAPVRDAHGTVVEWVGANTDITSRMEADRRINELLERERAARAAAERSEAEFRSLSNGIAQLAWMADAEGSIYWYNDRWYEYTGTTHEEMAGWGWQKVHHPEHVERVVAFVKEAWRKGEPWELTFPLRSKTGEWRWFLTRAIPLRDADGTLLRWFGTNTDIHERQEIEEHLRFLADASEALASSLDYDQTLGAVVRLAVPVLCDWAAVDIAFDGEPPRLVAIAHADPAKLDLARELRTKYPPDPGAPRGAANVIRTGRAELYPELPEELLRASARDEEHLRLLRELRLTSALVVPMTARGRTLGAITLVHDATSARRFRPEDLPLVEELARRAAFAVDNSRLYRDAQAALRARDEFMSIASHELRTPLMPLQLQLEALRTMVSGLRLDETTQARVERKLETSVRATGRLTNLVEHLLEVSRVATGRLKLATEPTDLASLVCDVAERFAEAASAARVDLVVRADATVRGVWDRLRIDQVIVNLVANALKYGAGKPVELHAEDLGETARLSVVDHGIGISAEDQARIFGRFERAVSFRHYGGLGLGLYISRQIVEAHGGKLSVESTPGKGATFRVELPKEPPRAGDSG